MAERRNRGQNSYNQGQQGRRPAQGRGQYNGGQYGGPNGGQYNRGQYNNQGQYQGGPYGQGPDDYYEDENNKRNRNKKRKSKRKVIFVVEVIVLLLLAVGLFVFSKFSKLKTDNIAKGDIIINDQAEAATSGYTNIALFGVDSREGKLDIETHSDALMIASINNKTKEIKLVSVYRDTYLDNTNGEYRKATECYYFGGPERSINMLNKNLDLNITDYVTVDFNVVSDVVDALGGVDIDVQEDEIQWINGYQEEGSEVTGKEIVPVTSAGLQTLNGLQALSYCRIRYTSGSDYRRTERQREVIGEMLKKAKTVDLLTLNSLIDAVFPKIKTSLSALEIASLAKDVMSYDMGETTGFPFDLTTANISAGDCVVPVNLANNVTQLHQWMFGTENYDPSSTVKEISNTITNNTGI